MQIPLLANLNRSDLAVWKQSASGHAWATHECLWRSPNAPMREMLPHGPTPLRQSRFPFVDLLPTAHQCDNDRPVGQPVHDAEHQGRFGVHRCEPVTLIGCCTAEKFLSHFRRIPGALGLVKDNDVLGRKLTCLPVGLKEGVDALNEGAHAPS